MKKLLILASVLAFTGFTAHAGIGLGSTLSECTQSWGRVLKVRGAENGPNGGIGYDFQSQGYGIEADCCNGRVWRIIYTRLDGTPFTKELIKAFLARTVPGADWTEIDDDGVSFLTDANGKSYGDVSPSSMKLWRLRYPGLFRASLSLRIENVFTFSIETVHNKSKSSARRTARFRSAPIAGPPPLENLCFRREK